MTGQSGISNISEAVVQKGQGRAMSVVAKYRKQLFQSVIVMVAVVTLMMGTLTPASAGTARLGGLDINAYCRAVYGPTATGKVIKNNVYGWVCAKGGLGYAINLNTVCNHNYVAELYKLGRQYPNSSWYSIYAAYSNYNNPYSWSCYRWTKI